jgi:hypothetical protein
MLVDSVHDNSQKAAADRMFPKRAAPLPHRGGINLIN